MNAQAVKNSYRTLGPPGWAAVIIGAIGLCVALWSLYRFAGTLLGPSPSPNPIGSATKENSAQHAAAFDKYTAQFNGRSLFFVPAAPNTDEPEVVAEEPAVAPKPTTYAGPAIIAMVNDTAWFDNGLRVKVGDAQDGVGVIELNPPWNAKLSWREVEFTVSFFEKDRVVFRDPAKPVAEPSKAELEAADAEAARKADLAKQELAKQEQAKQELANQAQPAAAAAAPAQADTPPPVDTPAPAEPPPAPGSEPAPAPPPASGPSSAPSGEPSPPPAG